MLGIQGYCDESQDGNRERVWVMAGYVGIAQEWENFTRIWGEALSRHGLSEFHMADCEHGVREFKTKSPNERAELQREFIGIINRSHIVGAAGGIMLNAYNDLLPYFKQVRRMPSGSNISGSLADPYFLAFQFVIELAVKNARSLGMPENEQITLVFDMHDLRARAEVIFHSLLQSTNLDYVRFIDRRVEFGDSHNFVPIQASDILAYEYRRYLDECHLNRGLERWQWIEIKKHLPEWHVLDREGLNEILRILNG